MAMLVYQRVGQMSNFLAPCMYPLLQDVIYAINNERDAFGLITFQFRAFKSIFLGGYN
jgi:hypothetical protein